MSNDSFKNFKVKNFIINEHMFIIFLVFFKETRIRKSNTVYKTVVTS